MAYIISEQIKERVAAAKATIEKELLIYGKDFGSIDAAPMTIAYLADRLPELRSLHLSGMRIGDAWLTALAKEIQTGRLSRLELLDLIGTQVGDFGLAALATASESGNLLELCHLNLSATDVRDAGVSAIGRAAEAGNLPRLKTLIISKTRLRNDGLTSIARAIGSGRLLHLETVELEYSFVGDAGVEALALAAEAGNLSSLKTLNLAGTQIGDAGLSALVRAAKLRAFPLLQKLDLAVTSVSDLGLTALAEAANAGAFLKLEELMLANTAVGDEGLAELARAFDGGFLPKLKVLNLKHTKVHSVSLEVILTFDANAIIGAVYGEALAEAKVVVLGEPFVGKSWLCKRFFQGAFPKRRRQTHDLELIRPRWKSQVGELRVGLCVWDFGGQHILHGTHELFLTERSICLLVLDATQVADRDPEPIDEKHQGNRLPYWLNMIGHFIGKDARLIIVVTQSDKSPDAEKLADIRSEYKISPQVPIIRGFSAIEADKPYVKALQELESKIQNVLITMSDVLHSRASRNLHKIKSRVKREIAKRALGEYRRWCEEEGMDVLRDQEASLRTLHYLGIVFYFGILNFERDQKRSRSGRDLPPGQMRLWTAERDSVLDDWLINPLWLKWPIYNVIRTSEGKSWLADSDIKKSVAIISKRRGLPRSREGCKVATAVLKLTELCFFDESRGRYFFPRGLDSSSGAFLTGWNNEQQHHCKWNWSFFPEAAIHRFLVRAHRHNLVICERGKCAHWRTGAVLKRDDAKVAVDAQPDTGRVTVWLATRYEPSNTPTAGELELVKEIEFWLKDFIGNKAKDTYCSWQGPVSVGLGMTAVASCPETPAAERREPPPAPSTKRVTAVTTFRQRSSETNGVWEIIVDGGKSFEFKPLDGFKYLHTLVQLENRPWSTDVVTGKQLPAEEKRREGVHDRRYRENAKARLEELTAIMTSGELTAEDRENAEFETERISKSMRDWQFPRKGTTTPKCVCQAIDRALKVLANHDGLSSVVKELSRCEYLGKNLFQYQPSGEIRWVLS